MKWLRLLRRWLRRLLQPRRRFAGRVPRLRRRVGRLIEGRLRRNAYCLWGDAAVFRAFRAPGGIVWARRHRWHVRWDSVLHLIVIARKPSRRRVSSQAKYLKGTASPTR